VASRGLAHPAAWNHGTTNALDEESAIAELSAWMTNFEQTPKRRLAFGIPAAMIPGDYKNGSVFAFAFLRVTKADLFP
jgi:hypothetical protein